jgi:hypothetical protein
MYIYVYICIYTYLFAGLHDVFIDFVIYIKECVEDAITARVGGILKTKKVLHIYALYIYVVNCVEDAITAHVGSLKFSKALYMVTFI